uniref:Uncharacterized protein n=1 Tax=Arundo donax TaxID=35708 RepID=A0A0A9ET59_ARUDO
MRLNWYSRTLVGSLSLSCIVSGMSSARIGGMPGQRTSSLPIFLNDGTVG